MKRIESVPILGTNVDIVTIDDVLAHIEQNVIADKKAIITYVNIHALNVAYQPPSFRDFLNAANINFCDGFGVSVGAQLLGHNRIPRLTPPDWISSLGELCVRHGFTMYFLGSRPGIAKKASLKIRENLPGLNIVGTHHGYFNKEPEREENKSVIENINSNNPNILWIGFGMPLQEKWLMENWDSLNVNVALTGGAIFDYISDEIRRGPKWLTNRGFEWLTRLLIEPKRLWRRYLIGVPLFFLRIMKERLRTQGKKND